MGAGWDGSLANRKTSDLEALLQLCAGSTAQCVLDPIRNTILLSLQILENQAESWQALHLRNRSLGLAESV